MRSLASLDRSSARVELPFRVRQPRVRAGALAPGAATGAHRAVGTAPARAREDPLAALTAGIRSRPPLAPARRRPHEARGWAGPPPLAWLVPPGSANREAGDGRDLRGRRLTRERRARAWPGVKLDVGEHRACRAARGARIGARFAPVARLPVQRVEGEGHDGGGAGDADPRGSSRAWRTLYGGIRTASTTSSSSRT